MGSTYYPPTYQSDLDTLVVVVKTLGYRKLQDLNRPSVEKRTPNSSTHDKFHASAELPTSFAMCLIGTTATYLSLGLLLRFMSSELT